MSSRARSTSTLLHSLISYSPSIRAIIGRGSSQSPERNLRAPLAPSEALSGSVASCWTIIESMSSMTKLHISHCRSSAISCGSAAALAGRPAPSLMLAR